MIRIVTLDRIDPSDMAYLSGMLYRAFGVGTEHTGDKPAPPEAEQKDGRLDALKLLREAPELAHVLARRIFRSLFSRQKVQSSISGRSASPWDHDGCMAHRAS